METQEEKSAAFLEHYGVKGMRWGHRKKIIKEARANVGKYGDATARAERNYVKARKSGDKKGIEKAHEDLNRAFRKEETNKLTAGTMTRGEQVAFGILGSLLVSPVGAAAGLGVNAALTRDSKKVGDYPIKLLQNLNPDDDD